MTEFRSNGARKPRHTVRTAARPQPGAIHLPEAGPGPKRWEAPARPAVTLADIPSLAREIAFSIEDRAFARAVSLAAEAMLEGAGGGALMETYEPFTIEEEGALVRAFGLRGRA